MLRIALSSVPPRFAGLGRVLRSLLAQGAHEVLLCLPHHYRRFPDWDGTLPDLPAGVTLLRVADRGPATKFLEPARRFPHDRLVIADDDCLYRPGWLDALGHAPVAAASTFDGARIGLPAGSTVVQGFAGVAFHPARLHPRLLDIPEPLQWVDDIWLSAMIAGAGLKVTHAPRARALVEPLDAPAALQNETERAELNRQAAATLRGCWDG